MIKIVRYNIQKHGSEVQNLLKRYIVPTYMKRMGLETEQQMAEYHEYESVLDPVGAYDTKFEAGSLVAVNGQGEIKGTMLSYFIKVSELEESIESFEEFSKKLETDEHQDKDLNDSSKGKCGGRLLQNDCNDSLAKYLAHRWDIDKSIHGLTKRFNVDRLLYIESTIVDPELRNRGIAETFAVETAHLGKEELVVSEGMVKKDIWERAGFGEKGYLGFTTHQVHISYDGLYCPLLFIEPGDVPEKFGKSELFTS